MTWLRRESQTHANHTLRFAFFSHPLESGHNIRTIHERIAQKNTVTRMSDEQMLNRACLESALFCLLFVAERTLLGGSDYQSWNGFGFCEVSFASEDLTDSCGLPSAFLPPKQRRGWNSADSLNSVGSTLDKAIPDYGRSCERPRSPQTWEMYLACLVLERGCELRKTSSRGPDLRIEGESPI